MRTGTQLPRTMLCRSEAINSSSQPSSYYLTNNTTPSARSLVRSLEQISYRERDVVAVEILQGKRRQPGWVSHAVIVISIVVPRGLVAQPLMQINRQTRGWLEIIEIERPSGLKRVEEKRIPASDRSRISQSSGNPLNRLPHRVAIGEMIRVCVEGKRAQRPRRTNYRARSCEYSRAWLGKTNVGLNGDVHIAVSEINPQTGTGRQSRVEAIGPAVLQIVYGEQIVAVFVNVDCANDSRPLLRCVGRMDLIALDLPGAYPCKGSVVVSEHEVRADPKSVRGARRDTEEEGVFVDVGKIARGVVGCLRDWSGRRALHD